MLSSLILVRAGRETELGREDRRGSRDWERDYRGRLEWVEAIRRFGEPDLLRDTLNSSSKNIFILSAFLNCPIIAAGKK